MKNWSRYLAIAVSILIVGAIFYYFSTIVAYVLVAWVLSMIGQPIMNVFKKFLKMKNGGSAALTLVTFMFLFTALIWVFVPPIVQQARNLAGIDYASLVKTLEEPINSLNNALVKRGLMDGEIIEIKKDTITPDSSIILLENPIEKIVENDTSQILDIDLEQSNQPALTHSFVSIDSILMANGDTVTKTNITLQININQPIAEVASSPPVDTTAVIKHTDTPIEKIQKKVFSAFNPARIPTLFSSLIGFMGNLLIGIMSVIFIAFFFLKENALFSRMLQATVPAKYENEVIHAVEDSSKMLRRYFIGVSIQVTIITIYMTALLSILGIQNALLIAFFAALINVIPYIGPIIGAMFGIFITISSNLDLTFYDEMLPMLLMVFAAFASMQFLDNFILQPYIFSNSVSAHPLEIFLVIMIGAQIGGIGGMVLAIPSYTVIRVVAKSFLSEFKIVQKLTKQI